MKQSWMGLNAPLPFSLSDWLAGICFGELFQCMRSSLASIAIAIVLIANRDSVLFKLDISHFVILMH